MLKWVFPWVLLVAVTLTIDRCAYRDPVIKLRHGYSLEAISPSSPVELVYRGREDDRGYSAWRASRTHVLENGWSQTLYLLHNSDTDELIEFDSESEWQRASREKRAAPLSGGPLLSDITAFGQRGGIVFGTYSAGYFILEIGSNRLMTWTSANGWSKAVARLTGEPAGGLRDAKNRLFLTRDPLFYVGAAVASVVLGSCQLLYAIRARLRRRAAEYGGNESTTVEPS